MNPRINEALSNFYYLETLAAGEVCGKRQETQIKHEYGSTLCAPVRRVSLKQEFPARTGQRR
jgi:hypothetical protein